MVNNYNGALNKKSWKLFALHLHWKFSVYSKYFNHFCFKIKTDVLLMTTLPILPQHWLSYWQFYASNEGLSRCFGDISPKLPSNLVAIHRQLTGIWRKKATICDNEIYFSFRQRDIFLICYFDRDMINQASMTLDFRDICSYLTKP